ncbi:LysR family transcriptional regulator [Aurantimonas sp. NFXS3]
MRAPRKSLPPMNAIRTFEAAGRCLSFRAASDELGVTQGAVAQQVRLLEDHLGLTLFTRLPRGIALTTSGVAYHAEIARAFDIMRGATEQLDSHDRSITLSVTPTFATRLLIPRLSSLSALLPDIAIRTIATIAISDLTGGQVDIAVRESHPPFAASLEAKLLFRQQLILVASPHILGTLAAPLTPEQVRRFPLLHDAYDHWARYFGVSGKLPGATFNHISHALDAALAGQGLAIVSRAFVQADLESGRLVNAGKAGYAPDVDYYLVRRKSRHPRQVTDAVWKWCIDTFSMHDEA